MGNMFKAHIFKRRSVGEREEVDIRMFNLDGSPFDPGAGESPLLAAWQGDFVDTVDYSAGDLVRKSGNTYLALEDAPHTGLEPGEVVALVATPVWANGEKSGWDLPRDVVATIADLAGSTGYNFSGTSRWFKLHGAPGETVTVSAVGSNVTNAFHFYDALGINHFMGGGNYGSPTNVVVPAEGFFHVEVNGTGGVTSFKYVGPTGPQPVPGNPWVLFA